MRIEWNPALAVGIEQIDVQQQELFRRADRVLEAIGDERADAVARVEALRAAAAALFPSEEQLLQETGAASLLRHESQHRRFLSDLDAAVDDLRAGQAGTDLLTWLPSWIAAHVGGTDRDLAARCACPRHDARPRPVAIAS